jgi:hypothetical protein
MLVNSVIISLFAAVASAAPYPVDSVVDAVEAQEQLPGFGGLGGLKSPASISLMILYAQLTNNQ